MCRSILIQSRSSLLLMLMLVIDSEPYSRMCRFHFPPSVWSSAFKRQSHRTLPCPCERGTPNFVRRGVRYAAQLPISIITRRKNNSEKRPRQKLLRAAVLHLPFTNHLLT